jgi:hypothetical protein
VCLDAFEHLRTVVVLKCGHRLCCGCFDEIACQDHLQKCFFCPAEGKVLAVLTEIYVDPSQTIVDLFLKDKGNKSIKMKLTQSLADLFTVAQAVCGCPPDDELRLIHGGHQLQNASDVQLVAAGLGNLDTIEVVFKGRGGGKRGRAGSAGAGGKMNKATKIRNCEEEIGAKMVRLQAGLPLAPPAVHRILEKARGFSAVIRRSATPISAEVARWTSDTAEEVVLALGNTNNLDERFRFLTEAIFAEDIASITEVETQLAAAKALVHSMTEYAVIKQFGEESGATSWAKLSAVLTRHMRGEPVEAPAAAAGGAAAAGPMDLGA